jgi:RNase P subunit RPR2
LQLHYGEDVASGLTETTSTASRDIPHNRNTLQDIFVASISNSIFSKSSMDSLTNDLYDDPKYARTLGFIESTSEDALEKMCQSADELTDNQQIASPLTHDNDDRMQVSQDDATPENESRLGNAIGAAASSWSDPIQEKSEHQEEEPVDDEQMRHKVVNRHTSVGIDNHSFESLWNEKQRKSSLNFKELWDRFEKTLNDKKKQSNALNIAEEDENLDFELVKSPISDQSKLNDLQEMVEILCRLSTECGLDAQGFICKGCKSPLVEISKANVCGFDSLYYCSDCTSNDKYSIPARIIYNWDFTQYRVSKRAADFFADYQFKPFIDFKVISLFYIK